MLAGRRVQPHPLQFPSPREGLIRVNRVEGPVVGQFESTLSGGPLPGNNKSLPTWRLSVTNRLCLSHNFRITDYTSTICVACRKPVFFAKE